MQRTSGATLQLSRTEYSDRVYACWLGKNCGGTLGDPLERMFGQREPFSVQWYTDIPEGGLPNDDLEMQLIWLKAVEERGFDLNAEDLADYWLDHIGYNFDEYGRSKANLRLGLLPPVSGAHNNPFRDCMGSPIRSEIWACIAPGVPEIAVRYAYQDAICDHAGGEGVFGEVFNAAVESAAFVIHERDALLDLGLSYIPEDCLTAHAIRTARKAHKEGLSWLEARERVLAATPHYIAQYAPINLGFQTIGWLYGEDFGDALCKAVNCGYDTDCTGATLGSMLGILKGTGGLPASWIEPLGEDIATNESWGGIKRASSNPNPIPATLGELTRRVCALGEKLLVLRDAPVQIRNSTSLDGACTEPLSPDDGYTKFLAETNPMQLTYSAGAISAVLDYGDTPVIYPEETKRIQVRVRNLLRERIKISLRTEFPEGWAVEPQEIQWLELEPEEQIQAAFDIRVRNATNLHNSNRGTLWIQADARPAQPSAPIVLLGARRWQYCGPYSSGLAEASSLLAKTFGPEELHRIGERVTESPSWERTGEWRTAWCSEDSLSHAFAFDEPGVWYARLFLQSPAARQVRLGIPANCPTKLWVNGRPVIQFSEPAPVRPDYTGDKHSEHDATRADVQLAKGWNEVLIKFVRERRSDQFEAYFVISYPPMFDGANDIECTQFPWEVMYD